MRPMFSRRHITFSVDVNISFLSCFLRPFWLIQHISMEWETYKQNRLNCHNSDVWKDHDTAIIITGVSRLHSNFSLQSVGHIIYSHVIEYIIEEEHEGVKPLTHFMSSMTDRKTRQWGLISYFILLSTMIRGPFSKLTLLKVLTLLSRTS